MFDKIEGGSVYIVPDNCFGFEYHCNLPPIGYGVNSVTGELQETDIIKRSDTPEHNFWDRYTLPKDWNVKRKAEKERQKFDKYYIDPYLESIRVREWKRRLCGVWFDNYNPKKKKVETLYITGTHYLYITYWKFQGKFMDFRINDMEFWYVMKYCETDPDCLGLNEITKRKLGKCFKKGTSIRMFDGSIKNVEDILDGEYVMGNDSKKRLVSGCTNGIEEMFEIIPNKGNPFTVNRSHILHCLKNVSLNNKTIKKEVNLTVDDYLKLSDSAKRLLWIKRCGWGDWGDNEHLVNPYFLGIWLGDGVSKCLQITNEDEEIVDYLKLFATSHGLKYHNCGEKSKSGNKLQHILSNKIRNNVEYNGEMFNSNKDLMISLGKHEKTPMKTFGLFKEGKVTVHSKEVNEVWDDFKRMNLPKNKHIPKEYLIDSRHNRLSLLAGLIDSDGCLVVKNNRPQYFKIALSNNYPNLQNDLVELIQSLGFYCGVGVEKKANAKVFTIFGAIEDIPTIVKRKQAWKVDRAYDSSITGFIVKSVGEGEYYGFAVDDNHLFLLADGTVVHNTAKLGCWLYDRTSKPPFNQHAGIQSKADDDAEEVMKKALVQPWQKLPDFFRPIYDTMKGDDPNELRFFHTSRRGSTTENEREEEEALESWIDFGASGEAVYDGPELDSYAADEAGKTKKPTSIKERQSTVRFCSEIDGQFNRKDYPYFQRKQLYTTTVEIEKGEEDNYEFQEMTARSNPLDRNENNRTTTGLYTFFLPAQKGMYFDTYGYPDEEKAITYLLNEMKKLEDDGDTRGLSSFKRKNPMTFKMAFSADGATALYDPELINNHLDDISWGKDLTERGNLEWKDGYEFERPVVRDNGEIEYVLNEIEWKPNPNGRFEKVIGWLPKEPNKVFKKNGKFLPNNNYANRVGCDPFKYDKTKDKRRSNCAAFNYQIADDLHPDDIYNDTLTLRYAYRATSTRLSNMDILKMVWWCGCQVLFERNVNHWKRDFQDWNCEAFLMYLPGEDEPGIYTDGKGTVVQLICNFTESYINQFIKKCFFKTLMRKETGWLGFKVEDTQSFDEPMAAGITFIAVKGKRYVKRDEKVKAIENIMPYHQAV